MVYLYPEMLLFFLIQAQKKSFMKPNTRICDTCKEEISDDLCRIVILDDLDHNPRVLFFHFSSDCWNMENFAQKFSNFKVIKYGFDADEKIQNDPVLLKKLKSDIELWL